MIKLLTVIVTFNGMEWIERCVSSVFSSSVGSDVIVIDNLSTDGTVDYIVTNFPTVTIIRNNANLGFGKANNIGLKFAIDNNYDYVYLLNQDAWVEPNTFERLIDAFQKHNNYGVLSPMQFSVDKQKFESYFVQFTKDTVMTQICEDAVNGTLSDVYSIPFVQAAHWMISAECLQNVGGFSPAFPHYGEDDNYLNRVIYKHFDVGVVPSAKAVHAAASKPFENVKKREYRQYISYLVHYNNVLCPKNASLGSVFQMALKSCRQKRSLRPLKVLCKFISNYHIIKEYRSMSFEKCAFINN